MYAGRLDAAGETLATAAALASGSPDRQLEFRSGRRLGGTLPAPGAEDGIAHIMRALKVADDQWYAANIVELRTWLARALHRIEQKRGDALFVYGWLVKVDPVQCGALLERFQFMDGPGIRAPVLGEASLRAEPDSLRDRASRCAALLSLHRWTAAIQALREAAAVARMAREPAVGRRLCQPLAEVGA